MTTTDEAVRAVAGAMERHCDNLGIPMPSPALARRLAEIALGVAGRFAREDADQIEQGGGDVDAICASTLRHFAELRCTASCEDRPHEGLVRVPPAGRSSRT